MREFCLTLFNAIHVPCDPDEIEVIHRLPAKIRDKPVIVKFKSRKKRDQIILHKALLFKVDYNVLNIPGFTTDKMIYMHASLCPYYRNLSYNCRLLKKRGLITNVVTGDEGSVKIKTLQGKYEKIVHQDDLTTSFPHFDFDFK